MAEFINSKLVGVNPDDEFSGDHTRQQAIRRFVKPEEYLLLEREPDNSYDPNAIAAYIAPDDDPWDEGEYKLGYLSKSLAEDLAPKIDAGWVLACQVLNRSGGRDGEPYGVNIVIGVYSPEEAEESRKKTASYRSSLNALNGSVSRANSTNPGFPQPISTSSVQNKPGIVPVDKKVYRLHPWRIFVFALIFIVMGVLVFTGIHRFVDFLKISAVVFLSSLFLLFPWWRWLFDHFFGPKE